MAENFDLRQSLKSLDVKLRNKELGEIQFNSIVLPILLKIRDIEALSFLSRQDGFVINQDDYVSFLRLALAERWIQGLKTFLLSHTSQFYFQSLNFSQRRQLLQELVKSITSISDV